MLSLLICSVKPDLLDRIRREAALHIGVPHELIAWDNRASAKGLCEVYNSLASRAKYPYLVFLHEDILFTTQGWGEVLLRIFDENPSAGLIGVAGSAYKSRVISGWYTGEKTLNHYQILHRENGRDERLRYPGKWEGREQQMITIDGVFMACRKQVWDAIRFNEDLLTGFHFYDIDFSFRVSLLHMVLVTERIEIIHETRGGDFGASWMHDAVLWHDHMAGNLPRSLVKVDQGRVEKLTSVYWCDFLKHQRISFGDKWRFIQHDQLYANPGIWYAALKLLVYRPLGLNKVHGFFKNKKNQNIDHG